MKKYFILLITFLVLSAGIKTYAQSEKSNQRITVEIDYGKEKETKTQTINVSGNITALEALQYAAEVHTHPAGNYVFVDAIDGVEGVRGKKGWYYEVNGKSADKLAIRKQLTAGDHVTWIYKKDVCSKKADKKDRCDSE